MEKEWKEVERRDLASSRLTNCKYLNCGCRMTLINIANGTECRRRNEEVHPWGGERGRTVRRQWWVIRGRREGEGGGCSEFLSSLPPDSIQLNFEITP